MDMFFFPPMYSFYCKEVQLRAHMRHAAFTEQHEFVIRSDQPKRVWSLHSYIRQHSC